MRDQLRCVRSGLEGVCEGMGGEQMGENSEGGEGEGFST